MKDERNRTCNDRAARDSLDPMTSDGRLRTLELKACLLVAQNEPSWLPTFDWMYPKLAAVPGSSRAGGSVTSQPFNPSP